MATFSVVQVPTPSNFYVGLANAFVTFKFTQTNSTINPVDIINNTTISVTTVPIGKLSTPVYTPPMPITNLGDSFTVTYLADTTSVASVTGTITITNGATMSSGAILFNVIATIFPTPLNLVYPASLEYCIEQKDANFSLQLITTTTQYSNINFRFVNFEMYINCSIYSDGK